MQLPPRGVWGRSGLAVHTTAESWLGAPMDPYPSIDAVVLRYLRAFGPAMVNDIQQWCGLTRLREVVERLRPDLCPFADEKGRELFDLPDAPRPDPGTPAPVRFLSEHDNLMLSHVDRSRVITQEDGRIYSQLLTRVTGLGLATVTIDGFLRSTWRVAESKGCALLTIWLFMAPNAGAAEIDVKDVDEWLPEL